MPGDELRRLGQVDPALAGQRGEHRQRIGHDRRLGIFGQLAARPRAPRASAGTGSGRAPRRPRSNTSRAARLASASAAPMPTAWLPCPGNRNARIVFPLFVAGATRPVIARLPSPRGDAKPRAMIETSPHRRRRPAPRQAPRQRDERGDGRRHDDRLGHLSASDHARAVRSQSRRRLRSSPSPGRCASPSPSRGSPARIAGRPVQTMSEAAFGDTPAFVTMWSYIISQWTGVAAVAVAVAGAIGFVIPAAGSGIGLTIVALGTIAILTLVNLTGARSAGWVQLGATLIKIIPLFAVVILVAIRFGTGQPVEAADAGPDHLRRDRRRRRADALLADRVRIRRRWSPTSPRIRRNTVPRATIFGTGFTGLIYLAATVAALFLLPSALAANSSAPFADAIAPILGNGAGALVARHRRDQRLRHLQCPAPAVGRGRAQPRQRQRPAADVPPHQRRRRADRIAARRRRRRLARSCSPARRKASSPSMCSSPWFRPSRALSCT